MLRGAEFSTPHRVSAHFSWSSLILEQ
jgi:hypothetical protein